MKLVKVQVEILEDAIESERTSGHRKPITIFNRYRGHDMTGYSKSFVHYIRKMWELQDAGVIAEGTDSYAYVVDLDKAETFIKENV